MRLRVLSHEQQERLQRDDDNDEEEADEATDHTEEDAVEPSGVPIDETFFYIKEHTGSDSGSKDRGGERATLFVANCPMIPNISTKLLLQSIFGRYGDVTRVTVISKPVNYSSGSNNNRTSSFIEVPYVNEPYRWTEKYAMVPSYYRQNQSGDLIQISDCEGKFAHVVFSSPKEMKRTIRTIHEMMSTTDTTSGNSAVTFDPIELQTLMDESDRQWRNEIQQHSSIDDDDHDDVYQNEEKPFSAVQLVAQQYRKNCQSYLNRQDLLEECNHVMELYEDEETTAERRRKEITSQPDDDGFITVSYQSTAVSTSTTNDLEQQRNNRNKRQRPSSDGMVGASKRTRNNKKKKGLQLGSLPIPDFYRFQTRQEQQNSISELRQRFEQDKIRIFQRTNK